MLTDDEKRQQHMEIGLALYIHSMANGNNDDRIFFTAVSQINKGGPESVYDANQKQGAYIQISLLSSLTRCSFF